MDRACLEAQAACYRSFGSTTDSIASESSPFVPAAGDAWLLGAEAIRYGFHTDHKGQHAEDEGRLLLAYMADGESSAFWRLWCRHQKYLYALCLRQMGGVQEDAEDALSRAMLKAWEKLPRYAATITDVRAWLARLISNLCIDIHRERTRRTRGTISIEEMTANDREPAPWSGKSPEDTLLSRETLRHLTRAVEELPVRLREPFVLRFLQEAPYREIARQLALTTDNARKRVQQARAVLRERLGSHLAGLGLARR